MGSRGCLAGKELPDPTFYPQGLSFGGGAAASPLQPLPTLGPANSTGWFCWGHIEGRWSPQPWSCGVPGAYGAGEPKRELLE